MQITDPIADMLTRIRNGLQARHENVLVPASLLKQQIARIMKEEGFIKDWELVKDAKHPTMRVWLRYGDGRKPLVTGLRRVSKPGLRVYAKGREMPRVLNGLGIAIVSTPRGVMTAAQARRENVGGEVLCYVW